MNFEYNPKIEELQQSYDHILNRDFHAAQLREDWNEVIKYAKEMKKITDKIAKLKGK